MIQEINIITLHRRIVHSKLYYFVIFNFYTQANEA